MSTLEIVGYVDIKGELYCAPCAVRLKIDTSKESVYPVYWGSRPHAAEACDGCGEIVEDAADEKRSESLVSVQRVKDED